ncbi:MAG: hypothetical protein ACO3S8_08080 [Aquiluna sp.]|jgi:hypothetical protein
MSVPPDQLMAMMRKSQQGQAQPPSLPEAQPSASVVEAPPMASPMSTPEPKLGSREGALINLSMALDLIEQSLPAFGADSDESQKILPAIRALNTVIGPRKNQVNDLQQTEILQLLQSLPRAGGMSPEARALSQAPIPGMPPGMPQPM